MLTTWLRKWRFAESGRENPTRIHQGTAELLSGDGQRLIATSSVDWRKAEALLSWLCGPLLRRTWVLHSSGDSHSVLIFA